MRNTASHTLSRRSSRVVTLAALLLLAPAADAGAATRGSAGRPAAAPGLVTVGLPQRAGGAVRLAVSARRPLAGVSVSVNGRRVPVRVRRGARERTVVTLGTAHRVRFGRNVVRVRAVGANGRTQAVRRVVVVHRKAPLAGMRTPAAGRQGQAVQLDGRGSRAARGGRLSYRWRVVAGPHRASARLQNENSARPRLIASHPGRYHVALTVTERGGRGARAAATSCVAGTARRALPSAPMLPLSSPDGAIASTPLEQLDTPAGALQTIPAAAGRSRPVGAAIAPPVGSTAAGCTTQFVSAEVAPASGPMGIAFDSMASYVDAQGRTHNGVRVGGSFYDVPSGPTAYAIYLNAHTLELAGTFSIPVNIPGGAESVATIYGNGLAAARGELLMVIAYPNATLVKDVKESDATAISNESFQLGDGVRTPDRAGRLTGWLQRSLSSPGITPSYRLVQPDRVPIDTQVDATDRQNAIRVGQQEWYGTLPFHATAGFHVLVLDPALRPQLGTPSVIGTNTNNGTDAQGQAALGGLLRQAANVSGATVIVQSIGRPKPTAIGSLTAGQAIDRLGGSEWLFLGLDGSGGYALIGNTPPLGGPVDPTASPEASSQWTDEGGDGLSGLLERRNDSAYEATLADFAQPQNGIDGPEYSFQQVVFQPFTPWPVTDTPRTQAAATYVATQLGLPSSGTGLCAPTPRPDVRAQYCNASISPTSLGADVSAVQYPAGQQVAFTADELAAVKRQLQDELRMVDTVRTTLATSQSSLTDALSTSSGSAQHVASQVIESIPEDPESALSGDLGLASAILYIPAEIPEAGEVIGFAASVLDLASDLTEDAGIPSPDWAIQTAAGNAGSTVQNRLLTAIKTLNSYRDVMVSDYGKLVAASRAAAGPWGVNGETANAQIDALQAGVKQWLYMAIVPSAYDLVRIPGADPATARTKVHCVWSSAPAEWQPWKNANPTSLFFQLNDWAGSAPKADNMMAMLSGPFSNKHAKAVAGKEGDELIEDLFGSVEDGNAGLVVPWFSDRVKWTIQRPKMLQPSSPVKPGYCSPNGG